MAEPWLARTRFQPRDLILGLAVLPGVALVVGGIPPGMRAGVAVGTLSAILVALFGSLNKRLVEHGDALTITAVELGAGEIVVNSIDQDGTHQGYDLEITGAVARAVNLPVIASGGAGATEHFPPAVAAGADAVLAATVFHFGTLRIGDVKASLADAGHAVR